MMEIHANNCKNTVRDKRLERRLTALSNVKNGREKKRSVMAPALVVIVLVGLLGLVQIYPVLTEQKELGESRRLDDVEVQESHTEVVVASIPDQLGGVEPIEEVQQTRIVDDRFSHLHPDELERLNYRVANYTTVQMNSKVYLKGLRSSTEDFQKGLYIYPDFSKVLAAFRKERRIEVDFPFYRFHDSKGFIDSGFDKNTVKRLLKEVADVWVKGNIFVRFKTADATDPIDLSMDQEQRLRNWVAGEKANSILQDVFLFGANETGSNVFHPVFNFEGQNAKSGNIFVSRRCTDDASPCKQGAIDETEFVRVVAHEIGHRFGLDHGNSKCQAFEKVEDMFLMRSPYSSTLKGGTPCGPNNPFSKFARRVLVKDYLQARKQAQNLSRVQRSYYRKHPGFEKAPRSVIINLDL